jgi:hypothetical protein
VTGPSWAWLAGGPTAPLETTMLQWSLLSGGAVGLGFALIVAYAIPPRPDLAAFLTTMSAELPRTSLTAARRPGQRLDWEDRLGHWLMRIMPHRAMPTADLDLLRLPPHRYAARRVIFGAAGLAFTGVLSALLVA